MLNMLMVILQVHQPLGELVSLMKTHIMREWQQRRMIYLGLINHVQEEAEALIQHLIIHQIHLKVEHQNQVISQVEEVEQEVEQLIEIVVDVDGQKQCMDMYTLITIS